MTKYIELEAAINEFDYRSQFYDAEWGNKRFAPDDVETIIRSVPAADVAPIVHAQWLYFLSSWENIEYLQCSNCKKNIKGKYKYKYCPHCGAKMDGDGE